MSLVRFYPEEIEGDLLLEGIDIFDWHTGEMSSRRLLVVLKALPVKGEYFTARRDGDWCAEEYREAALVNEMRLMRVDQAALEGQRMEVILMESPAQMQANEDLAEEHQALRAGILAQLHGQDLGTRGDG